MDQIQDLLDRLDIPQSALIGIVICLIYYFMPGCYDAGEEIDKKIASAKQQIQKNIQDKQKVEQAIERFKRFKETQETLGQNLIAPLNTFPMTLKLVSK
ncbi:MAG: hypothetical protein R2827_08230 [Bdellovibrionales bacterium]